MVRAPCTLGMHFVFEEFSSFLRLCQAAHLGVPVVASWQSAAICLVASCISSHDDSFLNGGPTTARVQIENITISHHFFVKELRELSTASPQGRDNQKQCPIYHPWLAILPTHFPNKASEFALLANVEPGDAASNDTFELLQLLHRTQHNLQRNDHPASRGMKRDGMKKIGST